MMKTIKKRNYIVGYTVEISSSSVKVGATRVASPPVASARSILSTTIPVSFTKGLPTQPSGFKIYVIKLDGGMSIGTNLR